MTEPEVNDSGQSLRNLYHETLEKLEEHKSYEVLLELEPGSSSETQESSCYDSGEIGFLKNAHGQDFETYLIFGEQEDTPEVTMEVFKHGSSSPSVNQKEHIYESAESLLEVEIKRGQSLQDNVQ